MCTKPSRPRPPLDPSVEFSEGLTETGSMEGGGFGPEKHDKRIIQRRPRSARSIPAINQPQTGMKGPQGKGRADDPFVTRPYFRKSC